MEDYVHRIGRTGVRSPAFISEGFLHVFSQRAGMKGTSFTYFTTDNSRLARELVNILREASSDVPSELEEMAMIGGGGGRGPYKFSVGVDST